MRVLVTAGATWVKVDDVRILTTVFTGNTGLRIAQGLACAGHQVTLIINTHCLPDLRAQNLRVLPFRYLDELEAAVVKELLTNPCDAIIHSAAVSDYEIANVYKGKIASNKKELALKLAPAPKIIKIMRKLSPRAVLVQFKLEAKSKGLLKKAYASLKKNNSDFVVANSYQDICCRYKAYLLDKSGKAKLVSSLDQMVSALIGQLAKCSRGK